MNFSLSNTFRLRPSSTISLKHWPTREIVLLFDAFVVFWITYYTDGPHTKKEASPISPLFIFFTPSVGSKQPAPFPISSGEGGRKPSHYLT